MSKESDTRQTDKIIQVDFANLHFCDPVGAVGLANLIGYFSSASFQFQFINHTQRNQGTKYLDDAEFFLEFLGEKVFSDSTVRSTTMPFRHFNKQDYMGYLYFKLMPWIAHEVNLSEETLELIRTCLEEVFHNIEYHSGVGRGFTISQHFPQKNEIHIAISDFGVGIPSRVRTLLPELSDAAAIAKACEEGFTTKTNVRNRGVGLSLLTKYVVNRNGGEVGLRSANGFVLAKKAYNGMFLSPQQCSWTYPGTLVHVKLRTDTLEELDFDVAQEDFSWS